VHGLRREQIEAEKVAEIAATATQRRDEHRGAAAAAIRRIQERGVTVATESQTFTVTVTTVDASSSTGTMKRGGLRFSVGPAV
jgi:Mg-chelatase subunit ChlD